MKKSTKSALLSALIFPGIGHLHLKCYKRGLVLMIGSLAALVMLIQQALERAADILNKMETSGTMLSNQEIAELISGSPNDSINIAAIVIAVCWFFGIFDSFRTGKQQDSV